MVGWQTVPASDFDNVVVVEVSMVYDVAFVVVGSVGIGVSRSSISSLK